jgi:SPP1 family predicted phage head-tail adaptor
MADDAGSRNRKIQIQRKAEGFDAANQEVTGWVPFLDRWARPLTATGMAAVRAADTGVPMTPGRYSWRINYTPSITEGMRVNYKGMTFDIRDIRHDLANREYTDLVCESGGNDG